MCLRNIHYHSGAAAVVDVSLDIAHDLGRSPMGAVWSPLWLPMLIGGTLVAAPMAELFFGSIQLGEKIGKVFHHGHDRNRFFSQSDTNMPVEDTQSRYVTTVLSR